jgi:hypothetical protein
MITFHCPQCHRPVRIADEHAGKKARCPGCRQVFAVPGRNGSAAPPAQPGKAAVKRPVRPDADPDSADAGGSPNRLLLLLMVPMIILAVLMGAWFLVPLIIVMF